VKVERPAPAVDVAAVEERRRAARALLLTPLLTEPAEELRLVRRHREELTRLFADGLGYRLVVEPHAARLFKAGLGRDGSRALLRRSGRAFAPRMYALLCLTVAALTRAKNQLLVDELVAEVRAAAVDAGVEVDLDAIADRRALHAALLELVDLGVLAERDGDLEHWAEQRTLSLLDVRRERLNLLVSAALGSVDGPDELLDVAALPSAAGGARVAVRRRLVESPLLSVTDLTPEQADWWARNRHREREWFRDRFGLDLELRAEGAVAIDPEDELSDIAFPGPGSTRHVALLWLEAVVNRIRERARSADRAERFWAHAPAGDVEACATQVLTEWGAGLKREHRDDPAKARTEALQVLVGVGLVRVAPPDEGDGWLVHAAAARYAARPALAAASATGEASLFDEADA
jgi:uncharacterized protein (TIGR02678 family)